MLRGAPRRKVIIVLRLNGTSGREMLAGVFRLLGEGPLWRLKLLQAEEELTPEFVRRMERGEADGLIVTMFGSAEGVDALAHSSISAVLVNADEKFFRGRKGKTAFVWNDSDDIGRRGAAHLLSCGNFASYGFVHAFFRQGNWSIAREAAFRREIEANGRSVETYPFREDCGSGSDVAALRAWLKALPKPAAVMAAADWRAVQVFDACQAVGIRVPGQVAILGTDNDDFECLATTPQLSSVQPDYEGVGYRAAAELEALLSARQPETPRRTKIPIRAIVSRGSTKAIPPATLLVRRGLAYIRAHAAEGIRPADVVAHLRVSRRLAELRFSQICDQTIRQAIENERLERAKKMLRGSDPSLARIAAALGFCSASHLSNLFKKRFGLSPRAWRAGES
jgi:LacI family transcriptional regulator